MSMLIGNPTVCEINDVIRFIIAKDVKAVEIRHQVYRQFMKFTDKKL